MRFLDKEVNTAYQLTKKFFREFNNESLIWITDLWIIEKNGNSREFLRLIKERHSFEALESHLKYEFSQTSLNNLIRFIDICHVKKNIYIPNNDLIFLSKENRSCWFLINHLVSNSNDFRNYRIKSPNPYFALLYLIFVEIKDKKISLDDIRRYLKILNGEKNPKIILRKYIDDDLFISWALKYTQKKYIIKSLPNFEPTTTNEELEILLGYWDLEYSIDKYRCYIEINELKKAWQQKIFRDKGGLKKLYHLPLTKKHKSQLEKLAEKKNISEAKVLEELIEKEYRNDLFENGKALY